MSTACSYYPPFCSEPCGNPAKFAVGLSRNCGCPDPKTVGTFCEACVGEVLAAGAYCRQCFRGEIRASEPIRLRDAA